MSLSTDFILKSLQETYGESVTHAEIRAWSAMNDISPQTVTKKLEDYKVGRGKWNLTVQEKLEQTYQAPPALPAVEQNLIPIKDDSFVKFGNFTDLKKIIQSAYSTLRLSRVSRVTVKRFLSNKRVLNSDENSSV